MRTLVTVMMLFSHNNFAALSMRDERYVVTSPRYCLIYLIVSNKYFHGFLVYAYPPSDLRKLTVKICI